MIDSKIIPPRKQYKVLLIGDSCIDRYVYGYCDRINPEAPVPILSYQYHKDCDGMASNVLMNLKSYDVDVHFVTNNEKIVKARYIDERYSQQVLRVDTECDIKPLDYNLPQEKFNALVISDYDKGFITTDRLFKLVDWFDGPIFIDSKKTNLPTHNSYIKINEHEHKLLDNKDSHNLIITRGSRGATYQGKNYSAPKVSVFDVCGAGDTFLATLVFFYLKYGRIEDAIPYANKAASIAVSNFGTYVLNKNDIEKILFSYYQ